MNSQKITGLATGTLSGDATNLQQVQTIVNNATTPLISTTTANASFMPIGTKLNAIPLATASVDLNGQKITNSGLPSLSSDLATKGYVDS